MRIAQVSPLFESVPPALYGGTERVVSYLTEELVRRGHDVTLFASKDSKTRARLVSPFKESLRLSNCNIPLIYEILQLNHVFSRAHEFDIVHFHIDFMHFPISRIVGERHLTTLHGRLDLPDLQPLYREFNEMPLNSISNAQRIHLPNARWVGTVYHGLPKALLRFREGKGRYAAFLGRISPEKGLPKAIEIAKLARVPLRIAAKIDPIDREYFESEIRPRIPDDGIEFLGEIDQNSKQEFLGEASALLFPIDWPEPFGLVMIEAMACGTPVIAFRRGSVPEVLEEGLTGFIVDNSFEAAMRLQEIQHFDRVACRKRFEERFSVERMTDDYLKLYGKLFVEGMTDVRQTRGAYRS